MPDDRPDYSEILAAISGASATWLGGILIHAVEQCRDRKFFSDDRAISYVVERTLERQKEPVAKLLGAPKVAQSSDAEWRRYYEDKCRAGRKELSEFRSQIDDIIRRIGPAARPEWIRGELEKVMLKH